MLETLSLIAYRQPITRGEIEEIRGVADATAAKIYADAYNTNPQSVEFYAFTRTMQAYEDMISEGTTLVLTTDSELFKFLRGMEAGTTAESDIPPYLGASTVIER